MKPTAQSGNEPKEITSHFSKSLSQPPRTKRSYCARHGPEISSRSAASLARQAKTPMRIGGCKMSRRSLAVGLGRCATSLLAPALIAVGFVGSMPGNEFVVICEKEARTLVGGWPPVDEAMCDALTACNGQFVPCSFKGTAFLCTGHQEDLGSSQVGCVAGFPGFVCNQSGSTLCRTVWNCRWDDESQECVQGSQAATNNAPTACSAGPG